MNKEFRIIRATAIYNIELAIGHMREALYYRKSDHDAVICELCPHRCRITGSHYGICRVRLNREGRLYSDVYGKIAAMHADPIEKKPLYHFFPGRSILSIGTAGCNLRCSFCQNWSLSQSSCAELPVSREYSPEEIASMAMSDPKNLGIAYTYNEPTINFEFMLETARLVHDAGGKNVMVTNGFIQPTPLQELFPVMDAFSVDLKAFEEGFYKTRTGSRLEPVLESLRLIARAGRHLEITNLVIPGLNDDPEVFETMVQWIKEETGKETALHLSRYFPHYRLNLPPTPESTLKALFEIAASHLSFVFLGNLHVDRMGSDTYCPVCHTRVIERKYYRTRIVGLKNGGFCVHCGSRILIHTNKQRDL